MLTYICPRTYIIDIEKTVPIFCKKKAPLLKRREAIPKTDLSILLENGSCESHTIQSPYL
jgi:hypothetical protein